MLWLGEHYFWLAMKNNLKMVIDKCELCQSSHPSLLVTYFWWIIKSRYPMVTRLKSLTSETVIQQLKHWFDVFRYPWVLQSFHSFASSFRNSVWTMGSSVRFHHLITPNPTDMQKPAWRYQGPHHQGVDVWIQQCVLCFAKHGSERQGGIPHWAFLQVAFGQWSSHPLHFSPGSSMQKEDLMQS